MQDACHIWTQLFKWPCSPRVLVAQWIEHLPGVREVMGSFPVGDSDFFLCPSLMPCWSVCFSHTFLVGLNRHFITDTTLNYIALHCISLYYIASQSMSQILRTLPIALHLFSIPRYSLSDLTRIFVFLPSQVKRCKYHLTMINSLIRKYIEGWCMQEV